MTVTIDLKGKDKTTGKYKTKDKNCLRINWVKECQADVRKWLEAEYELDILELESALQTCIEQNSLGAYPKTAEHFKLDDCYVNIDNSEENVQALVDKIIDTLTEVEEKVDTSRQYLEAIKESDIEEEIDYFEGLLREMWKTEINQNSEYYFYNLCNYDRSQHYWWDKYLKEQTKEMFRINKQEDDDVFNW